MQSVDAAFTAEQKSNTRRIAHNLQVSWKKFSTLANRTFTIGVSTIGGNDVIGINPGAVGSPGNYKYFDESAYVTSLAWERGLSMPIGGLSKAMAEATLDNTSGRFTPRYMGGNSELFTAILPQRPMIINAGFEVGGVEIELPQFAGLVTKQPYVDMRSRTLNIQASDYIDYFQNKYLDQEAVFTSQRTDTILQSVFDSLGLSTSQYVLDYGINIVPYAQFSKGTTVGYQIHQLVEAENGHFYQDEEGIFRFENRDHWASSPHNSVSKVVLTGQVLNAETPTEDNLINVVEIRSEILGKQPNQLLFQLYTPIALPSGEDTELFVNFDDPILELQTVNGYEANTVEDESGTDITTSISVKSTSLFTKAVKIVFSNNSSSDGFLTQLYLYGRPVKKVSDLYFRAQDDSSVTAFQERPYNINNPYIQDEVWAASLGNILLADYSNIENLQRITIRAIPELQLGDLISWQGRYWRVYDIKSTLDPFSGFIQELTLLQRTITSYFRIGISTIGGSDKIAP